MSLRAIERLDASPVRDTQVPAFSRPLPMGRWWISASVATELSLAAAMLLLAFLQATSYPVTRIDVDGYLEYAGHILQNGTLIPSFPRSAGYPLFIALVTRLSGWPMHDAVYWVQIGLALAFAVATWAFVRARIGRLPALLFLGIVAAPNFWILTAIMPFPDVLFSAIAVPLAVFVGWWAYRGRGYRDLLWLAPIGVVLALLQGLRPNAFTMMALYAGALAAALVVCHRWSRGWRPLLRHPFWVKSAGLVIASALVLVATDYWSGPGARNYGTLVLAYGIGMRLPAASDAPEEQRIEAAKRRFLENEGESLDRTRGGLGRRAQATDMYPDDVLAVWRARLLAHPWQFVLSIGDTIRWNHHITTRRLVPFFADVTTSMPELYPDNDGSLNYSIFRATGIILTGYARYQSQWPLLGTIAMTVLELALFWGLLAFGTWHLARLNPRPTLAAWGLVILWAIVMSAVNVLDARYMLPFAIPCWVVQAVGLARLAWLLDRR